jgi:hypothetical protein
VSDDFGPEPTGKLLHAPVTTGRDPDDRVQIEGLEAVLDQGARYLDRKAVAPPVIGRQLDPKDGSSLSLSRLAKTGAPA